MAKIAQINTHRPGGDVMGRMTGMAWSPEKGCPPQGVIMPNLPASKAHGCAKYTGACRERIVNARRRRADVNNRRTLTGPLRCPSLSPALMPSQECGLPRLLFTAAA
jgi:hypothetical protein